MTSSTTMNNAEYRTWATHCCGCCCDMRTAVIVVNIISIVLSVPLALLFIAGTTAINSVDLDDDAFYQDFDDDASKQQAQEEMNQMKETGNIIMSIFIFIVVIKMIANALGIYGAVKYKVWPVMVSLVSYIIDFTFSLVMLSILGLIMPGFFAYPHVFFIMELKRNAHARAIAENMPEVEMHDNDEPMPVAARIV